MYVISVLEELQKYIYTYMNFKFQKFPIQINYLHVERLIFILLPY
jgi:hypothetical protein